MLIADKITDCLENLKVHNHGKKKYQDFSIFNPNTGQRLVNDATLYYYKLEQVLFIYFRLLG